MSRSQQTTGASKSDVAALDDAAMDRRIPALVFDLAKDLSLVTDKLMAGIDSLRELQETMLQLLRQGQIEQTRIAILAELQRRDLEEDLARVKKINQDYESFRETTQ